MDYRGRDPYHDYRHDPHKGHYRGGGPPVTYQPSTHHVAVNMGDVRGEYKPWNWCLFVTTVISVFCCQPFGLIAMVMGLLAYSDHKARDFYRSQSKRRTALGFGVTAIVLGVIWIILVIVAYSVLFSYFFNIFNK